MNIDVGAILVIESYFINYAVFQRPVQVVAALPKSLTVVSLDFDGKVIDPDNTKRVMLRNVVAVLDKVEDYAPYAEMNTKLNTLYEAYQDERKKMDIMVKNLIKQNQN